MSYTNFLKDFIDTIYWNIDQLLNYFDIDTIRTLGYWNIDHFLDWHWHIDHLRNYFDTNAPKVSDLYKYFHEIRYNKISDFVTKTIKFPSSIKHIFDPNPLLGTYALFWDYLLSIIRFSTYSFSLCLEKLVYFYYPLIESLQIFLKKFCNGEWITNFTNLSLVYNEFIKSVLNEEIFLKSQYTNSLTILQLPIYLDNKLFVGFFNSLFLSLPLSCNQLLCIYTSLIYGPKIGIFATLGWIFGEIFLFTCILFGIKPIIIQWFSLDILNYFIALYLIITFLYFSIQAIIKKISPGKRRKKRNQRTINKESEENNKEQADFLKIQSFALHSFLSWTENGYFFSYFNSFNTSSEPTLLNIPLVPDFHAYISLHLDYLLGILFGCLFFSYLYNYLAFKLCLKFYRLGLVKLITVTSDRKRRTSNEYQRERERKKRRRKRGERPKSLDFKKRVEEFDKKWEERQQEIEKEKERLRDKYKYPYKYDYIFFKEIKESVTDHREDLIAVIKEEIKLWDFQSFIKNLTWKSLFSKQKEKTKKIADFKKFFNVDLSVKDNLYSHYAKRSIRDFLSRSTIRLLILILGLTISSFSYYDISYVLTSPLGFIPRDEKLKTILLHTNQEDYSKYGFGSNPDYRMVVESPNLGTDIMVIDSKEYKNLVEFEDVNYQAEYAWLSKVDRAQGRLFPLKILKRKNLRENQDNKDLSIINFYKAESLKRDSMDKYYKSTYKPTSMTEENLFLDPTVRDNYFLDHHDLYRSTQWKNEMDLNFKLDFLPYDRMKNWSIDTKSSQKQLEIEEEIKQKYYINPLYKLLLNLEADRFISRLSNNMILTEFEENDLFDRRKALSNYYESNFYYSRMDHFDLFRGLFFNSKSSMNNSYNQQFKGTLRILERLFPITLDQNQQNRSVLKYDSPLFQTSKPNKFLHEEIFHNNLDLSPNYKGLSCTSSTPLFLGWNTKLNQLVITNNLILKEREINNFYLPSFDTDSYLQNSLSLLNLQKLNNLMRHSYSILRSPLMLESFSNPNSNYQLDLADDMSFRSVNKISFLTRSQPNNKITNNWLGEFNWYSFRYDNVNKTVDSDDLNDYTTRTLKEMKKMESSIENQKGFLHKSEIESKNIDET